MYYKYSLGYYEDEYIRIEVDDHNRISYTFKTPSWDKSHIDNSMFVVKYLMQCLEDLNHKNDLLP